jgi:hypothetical protein
MNTTDPRDPLVPDPLDPEFLATMNMLVTGANYALNGGAPPWEAANGIMLVVVPFAKEGEPTIGSATFVANIAREEIIPLLHNMIAHLEAKEAAEGRPQ